MSTRTPIDTLGFLDALVAEGRRSFTTQEAAQRLGRSPSGTVNALTRMLDEGLVDRVRRGHYTIRALGVLNTRAAAEDIALAVASAFAGERHRIAFLSALSDHDLLTRPVRTIFVAVPRRVFSKEISGRPLRAVIEAAETMSIGSERIRGSHRSDLERALLESAARLELVGGIATVVEALGAAAARLDVARLNQHAEALGLISAHRRIGSLVDQLSIEPLQGSLRPLKPISFDLDLEPGLDEAPLFRDRTWGLRWTQPVSELRALVEA